LKIVILTATVVCYILKPMLNVGYKIPKQCKITYPFRKEEVGHKTIESMSNVMKVISHVGCHEACQVYVNDGWMLYLI
jgi:hypothetical protein